MRKYKVFRASIYRWVKLFNWSSKLPLIPKSHRPLSPHPNAHSQAEIKWITDCCRHNPNFGPSEIYFRLFIQKPYFRSYYGFYRCLSVLINIFFIKNLKRKEKRLYHTPDRIGYKMQLNVKHVPKHCKHKNLPLDKKYYQYTIID